MDFDVSEIRAIFIRAEQVFEKFKPTPAAPSANFDVLASTLFKDYLQKAVGEVSLAAAKAGVSPVGFQIDECFCDFGEIETSGVVDVIDEAAAQFGVHGSDNYKYIVNAMCDALSEKFAEA